MEKIMEEDFDRRFGKGNWKITKETPIIDGKQEIAITVTPPNDPSSATGGPKTPELQTEAAPASSLERVVRLTANKLDDANCHVNTSNISFQIDDKMPMPSVRRGYVQWADQSESTAKIVRLPAVVFGELVMFNKSDMGLLIERDFDNVFGT